VDRLFALWQATHPQTFIPAGGLNDAYGTFTIAPSTIEDSATILTPFSTNAVGDWYTSDTSRYMKTFGYTYPEIQDWNQDATQLAQTVTAKVNALYAPKGRTHRKRHPRDMAATKEHEWFANMGIDKRNLKELGTVSVMVFLGNPPADPSAYKGASNLAGSLTAFVPPNFSAAHESWTYGEVSLQDVLKKAALPDYSEATVVTYLTQHLQWKVQTVCILAVPKKETWRLLTSFVG
jgi:tyrosinase